MGFFGLFNKEKKATLDKGLSKTKSSVFDKLARAVAGRSTIDDEVLDNLEEALVTSDVGIDTTLKIIERIEQRVRRDKYVSSSELNALLREEIATLLEENAREGEGLSSATLGSAGVPYVILVVGVNGGGKPPPSASLLTSSCRQARRFILVLPTPSALLPSSRSVSGVSARVLPSSSNRWAPTLRALPTTL